MTGAPDQNTIDSKDCRTSMSVDRLDQAEAPAARPSVHVLRARKLLLGGAVGGVAASLVCLVVFGLVWGVPGLLSAAFAAAMVLFFYGVGQYVMVLFADAGARTLLTVSMVSYTTRVVALGLVLVIYDNNADAWTFLRSTAVFVTVVAVVAGWLAVEVLVFSRLRINAYDTEYVAPSRQDGAQ